MRKIFRLTVFLFLVAAVLYSCHSEFDATIDELDLAITKYDEDQNFNALNTFFLYDTIIYITDDEDADPPDINDGHGPHIISQVRQNLLNIGWVEDTI